MMRGRVGLGAEVEGPVGTGERHHRHVGGIGGAADEVGDGVALELGQQGQALGAGEVVEAVVVLQGLELTLEHEVEGAAEHAAEQRGLLGEAADPQVDVLQAGDRLAVGAVPPAAGTGQEGRASRSVRQCRR